MKLRVLAQSHNETFRVLDAVEARTRVSRPTIILLSIHTEQTHKPRVYPPGGG